MKNKVLLSAFVAVSLLLAVSVLWPGPQILHPGSVWGVTMIRIHSGMDQAYLEYLDTQLKKESEISMKNGFHEILQDFAFPR